MTVSVNGDFNCVIQFIFVTVTCDVFPAQRNDFLNVVQTSFGFKGEKPE
jgi:hypothetical protein